MRYIILILINMPVILLALLNLTTKYKLGRISKQRLQRQMLFWLVLLMLLIASFPVYNLLSGRPALLSNELSFFDIVETTVIIFLLYALNTMRQRLEYNEQRLHNLHQELSIRLSSKK